MYSNFIPHIQFIFTAYLREKTIKSLSNGLWVFLIIALFTEILFPSAIFAEEETTPKNEESSEEILLPARRGMGEIPIEQIVKSGSVWTTAYSSTPDQTDSTPFITANGKHVYDGLVAANFLPFGAKVRFPEMFGEKIFTVNDRMNKRYNYRIDIWMASRDKAIQHGVRKMRYEILQ